MAFHKRTGPPARHRRAPKRCVGLAATHRRHRSAGTTYQGSTAAELVRQMADAGIVCELQCTADRRRWDYHFLYKRDQAATCAPLVKLACNAPPNLKTQIKVAIFCAVVRKAFGLTETA